MFPADSTMKLNKGSNNLKRFSAIQDDLLTNHAVVANQ